MAKRNVLHISKLEDLKKWMIKDGWELLQLSNNPYEVYLVDNKELVIAMIKDNDKETLQDEIYAELTEE